MRISDWSSDVCSSDLANRSSSFPLVASVERCGIVGDGLLNLGHGHIDRPGEARAQIPVGLSKIADHDDFGTHRADVAEIPSEVLDQVRLVRRLERPVEHARLIERLGLRDRRGLNDRIDLVGRGHESGIQRLRSEEHTSELQSLMRISYAVFCLKKKNTKNKTASL